MLYMEADISKISFGEYVFNISTNSFYQVNPVQTEKLYNLAIDGANLDKQDVILDLYCGIGTIGIFASKYVKKVYGIEIVEEAIENAKENSKLNSIDNIEFMVGDVEKAFENLIKQKSIMPDVVFVDPPRKGLDETTVGNLLKVMPKKIIYISCNPATLMRDLSKLEEKYEICKITPVDMFPFTRTRWVCISARFERGGIVSTFLDLAGARAKRNIPITNVYKKYYRGKKDKFYHKKV